MADDDAVSAEMRRPRPDKFGSDPLALDEATVERLLGGLLDARSAPAAYTEVAELLAAATAPAQPDELTGVGLLLAAFRAAHPPVPARAARQRARPPRRVRAAAAALAIVATLLLGGVAAAVTGLPVQVGRVARAVLPGAPAPSAPGGQDRPGPTAPTTTGGRQGDLGRANEGAPGGAGAQGTATASQDLAGLCRAYLAGQGSSSGGKLDAPSFQALATAAGGADKVAAYCQGGVASPGTQSAGQPQHGGNGHAGHHRHDPGSSQGPSPEALRGLCHAYLTGKGGKLDATAMQTLVTAAGGADRVEAYCQAILR
jgi:hypothetical protein